MRRALALLVLPLTLASCSDTVDDGRIDVSVIGDRFALPDPDRAPLTTPDRILAGAVASGLVALDGNGQVEPALAESWIVTSDGLSTIFRVRNIKWRSGADISGEDVSASLTRAMAPDSRNPMKPLLTAVDAVVSMTGQVTEVRLKVPRPNLLQLLAQPELGIRKDGGGLGVFRVARLATRRARLVPATYDDEPTPLATDTIDLYADRAALAVARFTAGDADLVTGGTFADWPVARAATLRPGRLRYDPVEGLFGLAIVSNQPFLSTSDVRAALAMAIDRSALAANFKLTGWTTLETVLPDRLDSSDAPAAPDWSGSPIGQRRADAAATIGGWRGGGRTVPVLRVALPSGPGMRILFARIAADWRRIGVRSVAVPINTADADLRLIDAVAPNNSANWYLTMLSCAAGLVCDARGDAALEASRSADTLALRSARIADADAALAARSSFIPLGVPMRWSLVNPALTGWKENVFGTHPLHELRPPRAVEY